MVSSLEDAGILQEGLLRTKRGIKCIAKDGHICNSLAEMEIDNWLYLNRISHEKEPYYPPHDKYNPNNRLRADFKVNDTLIEYAGLLEDPEYLNKIKNKKALAKASGINLLLIKPGDLSKLNNFLKILKP